MPQADEPTAGPCSHWAPGDLAVRIKPPRRCDFCGEEGRHKPGWIGTVSSVELIEFATFTAVGLFFEGEPRRSFSKVGPMCYHKGYNPASYRKIKPLSDDEKREFEADLRNPQLEPWPEYVGSYHGVAIYEGPYLPRHNV
jgi:hypothetical protein